MVYNLLAAPPTVSNTYAQAATAQSFARHVQHIKRLSRATCHMPLGTKGQLSHDRVEIAFILLYWLKPLTDEGGRKPEHPEKKPLTTKNAKY